MSKLLKNRKFNTKTEQKRCPIGTFSRLAKHDYPIHEEGGAFLVSANITDHKIGATKSYQHLSGIQSCQKNQKEAQSTLKLSPRTIQVIQAAHTVIGGGKERNQHNGGGGAKGNNPANCIYESKNPNPNRLSTHAEEKCQVLKETLERECTENREVNEGNGAAKNDIHDKEKNVNPKIVCSHTEEKTAVENELVKEKSAGACRDETSASRSAVKKKSVKRRFFPWQKNRTNQIGTKIVPVNQQRNEKHDGECRGTKYKGLSKNDNTANRTVGNETNSVRKKFAFWKMKRPSQIGKKVVHLEQQQSDKLVGHDFEGESSLVKEGGNITTTTTSKLANVTNVRPTNRTEVISHRDNGTSIHNHYHFYGGNHFHQHNHGLEIYRNKTYYTRNLVHNGIINTGNRSKCTVNIDGTETSQQTRRNSV